jgi:hypothetical protein
MKRRVNHPSRLLIPFVFLVLGMTILNQPAHAACGATSCFVVIGAQQQVPQQGLLTVNGFYSYTPQRTLLPGTNGIIPEVDQTNRRLIPNHHRELSTITQNYTLDLNYGVTDRFGIQLTVPYLIRKHDHFHVHGGQDADLLTFSDQGLGDMRITAKYNVLPTIRSMIVLGLGVDLPTGFTKARDSGGGIIESPIQLGRGQVGVIGSMYQTYELIPHRLNQFIYGSYRHTFRNDDGYQFGDEFLLNGGFNLVTVPWLVLMNQVNYRYVTHDNFSAAAGTLPIQDLRVPNTGSSFLAYTPGIMISATDTLQFYGFAQIPLVRDFNNNLAQGISFTFGVTKYFATKS